MVRPAACGSFGFYLAIRLLCGVGMSGVTQAGYTLATELVGPSYRTLLTTELWAYQWAAMASPNAHVSMVCMP